MAEGAATAPAAGGGGDESATDGGKWTYLAAAGWLSWESAALLSRRFRVHTLTGRTLSVFK